MKKKLHTCSLLLLLASTCTFAAGNFYVGIGAGPQNDTFNQNASIKHTTNLNIRDKTIFGDRDIFGSIFGGYEYIYKQLSLAVELKASITPAKYTSSNDDLIHLTFSHTHYRIRHNYGISILPGYIYSPSTVFYALLGYARGNFDVSTTDTSLLNISRNLDGLRYGLGIRQNIACRTDLRMEFSRINYQSTLMHSVTEVTKNTKVSPTTNQVEFAILYHFA